MRQTFVMRDGQLIPKHLVRPRENKRSHLSAPMIIRDSMDATLNHLDGKLYDSKSAYTRTVRQAGCEIIGNEKVDARPPTFDTSPAEADVKQAMDQLGVI